jgi:hypothetical protein
VIALWWLLPVVVFALRYGLGLSWWASVPVGVLGSVCALSAFIFLAGKHEDRNLRKRGLPMLDDRWPDDFGNSN